MNSFLLNSRRAFRKSGGSGVSTWTFDLSTLTYMNKSQSLDIAMHSHFMTTSDGRLIFIPGIMFNNDATRTRMRVRSYDTTAEGYDPLHPWDLPFVDLASTSSGYMQSRFYPTRVPSSGSNAPTSTAIRIMAFTFDREGRSIYCLVNALINEVQGYFFLSIPLDEPWAFDPIILPSTNTVSSAQVSNVPDSLTNVNFTQGTFQVQGGTRHFSMSTVGMPAAVYNTCGISIAGDGSRFYVLSGYSNSALVGQICQVSMADPFDVSTIRRSITTVDMASFETDFGGKSTRYSDFQVSPDGLRAFLIGAAVSTDYWDTSSSADSYIYEFSLNVPYDVTSMSPVKRVRLQDASVGLSSVAPTICPTGMFIDEADGGSRVFLYDARLRTLFQFSVTSPS